MMWGFFVSVSKDMNRVLATSKKIRLVAKHYEFICVDNSPCTFAGLFSSKPGLESSTNVNRTIVEVTTKTVLSKHPVENFFFVEVHSQIQRSCLSKGSVLKVSLFMLSILTIDSKGNLELEALWFFEDWIYLRKKRVLSKFGQLNKVSMSTENGTSQEWLILVSDCYLLKQYLFLNFRY